MSARRSKIGRLPETLRNELNRRMLDGQQGPQLLPWLNSLPEAKAVIEAMPSAGGKKVGAFDDNNLSDWRLGGFQEWLQRREQLAETRELASYSMKLAKAAGGEISEGAAAMLAGELLSVMEELRAVRSSDSSDSSDPSEKLLALTKAIDSASRAIALVRAGDHSAAKLAMDRQKIRQADEALRLERIRLDAVLNKAAERLLDEALRLEAARIAGSNLSNAEKIAALRKAAFADVDALEASGAIQLPV